MLSAEKIELIEHEIHEEKKTVDFDTKEFTIEHLVQKYLTGIDDDENDIYVPEYQREFVWDDIRQSTLIESIVLGLPIPVIFLAEDHDGRLEIVDGSQRIRTIAAFIDDKLTLKGLKKLKHLNDISYSCLPKARQRKIVNTSIRTIVLSESANEQVKNDLFERINKGSDLLRNMEKRKGIYSGEFTDFIYSYTKENKELLNKIAPLSKTVTKRQEHEELVLRFFALVDSFPKYQNFSLGIISMLDDYMAEKNKNISKVELINKKKMLDDVLKFVSDNFINGFCKKANQGVSRMFFEALSVGVARALHEKKDLTLSKKINPGLWLNKNHDFKMLISGKYRSHSPEKIRERINFVKEKLIVQ
ncbi:DUF262 domain-containing protein [Aliivibrio fischeri]|uniref:GmrSD restriction endonucleases N-terminal domain-containing protein n=1 Tax=Aliivibrio fischeri TaxID=668 RepID=A0A510UNE7_ALIFS|nr:DUF262 domain-containing protein [Aliivibrio fischeri]GEK16183.1 hypothetical protein AFI02nite_42190 [Aliivibrio fischeri]